MSEHAPQPDSPAPAEEKTLDKLLAEAQARIEEQKDAWMRAMADAENARKRARADVEAAWGDVPGVMTVYDRTGGPVRWGGPRGWERFGEYLESGGYDEASAAAADDAEAWVAREWAAHEAREREAYERDPAAYMEARENPRRARRGR